MLRVKMLAVAQTAMNLSSISMVCDSDAGTMRCVSSAYFELYIEEKNGS